MNIKKGGREGRGKSLTDGARAEVHIKNCWGFGRVHS